MDRKVVISKTAERKLNLLFDYLIQKWSVRIKNKFIERLDSSIEIIKNQPDIFPESKKNAPTKKSCI
ncbi:plasmid stabilization system [Avrilella dinanensis]|uniref:Plasmid stabilization system n=1 Tax=Avrilella dinanensis TaxID=2008672 RepID=A0A2M9R4B8_9FLAO|nr:plasmid stabilization system [Avrilella dinanensis]